MDEIRDVFQDSNLNFLIGSGLSSPFLRTLGNIEALLTDLAETPCSEDEKKIVRCSLYKQYFDGVIVKNPDILALAEDALTVLNNYKTFLRTINSILLSRKSTVLGKEANLFTTNLDVFIEKSIEDLGLECNDGFNPYLRRMFIHGARAAVLRAKRRESTLGKWMSGLETRAARNVVIVATANKLARISWAVLASGENYHPTYKARAQSN